MSNREANYVEVEHEVGKGYKARRWVFTWNNYTEENVKKLQSLTAEDCDYLLFGYEIAPTKGTPHLQGYVEFNVPLARSTVKSRLDPVNRNKSKVHVNSANGTRQDSYTYITKAETKDPSKLNEDGTPIIYEGCFREKKPGHRTDWEEIYKFLENTPDFDEFARHHPEIAVKYHGGIERIIRGIKNKKMLDGIRAKYRDAKLHPWQQELVNEIKGAANDRKIVWYYDEQGNTGKTWVSKLLYVNYGAAYFTNSKTADIAYAYNGEPIVVFDFSRSNEDAINYGVIEAVKNGILFSNKYEARTKLYNSPHVIIMANFAPNKSKLSMDRWDVRLPGEIDAEALQITSA